MKKLFALLALCVLAQFAQVAKADPCDDTYEGFYMSSGNDSMVFLTCWPVAITESTVWKDLANNPVDPSTLTFDDTCIATGCIDTDGFTLIADEVVVQGVTSNITASDEQIVMGISSGPAWYMQAVSNDDIGTTGTATSNPTITLVVDQRYTFTNAAAGPHPFALIAKDATAAGDTVVLSQGAAVGSMESDIDVDWEDNGNDITFTLTPALVTALEGTIGQQPGYRCQIHVGAMRGNITIQATSSVEQWLYY